MPLFNPHIQPFMATSLSIIIVNYNSWQVLSKLLQSILTQVIDEQLIDSLKIVIVDNNSSQSMPDFSHLNQSLHSKNIEIIWILHPSNAGFAAGCNLGAGHADSELLLFCNPDIVIPENGLNALVKEYQAHDAALLAPAQVNNHNKAHKISGRFPSLLRYIPLLGGVFKQAQSTVTDGSVSMCDWISGAVILMKNKDFKHLGGWDESFFMFMEDVDLCYRASQNGLTVGVTDKTIWLHHHGISSKQRMVDRVRSKSAALAAKHIYVKKHFKGWRKYLAQVFISLKYIPELLLGWLLSWLIPKPIFVSRRLILHRHLSDFKNGFKKSS